MNRASFFEFGRDDNGSGKREHPLHKWWPWVLELHPQLVDQAVDKIEEVLGVENHQPTEEQKDQFPEILTASGYAHIMAGSQMLFDVGSGIATGEDVEEVSGQNLEIIAKMRNTAHGIVDNIFDQYTAEFKEKWGLT